VRRYWSLVGEPDRTVLIRRERAYHGMQRGRDLALGDPAKPGGYGSLLQDVVEASWATRRARVHDRPVGAGGLRRSSANRARRRRRLPAPGRLLEAARGVCREAGVLFIADEVITGFGRCGAWFASGRSAGADLITCAKGITSGYLPLGAVIAAPSVWEPFWREGAGMFRHGYTYSGHAACPRPPWRTLTSSRARRC
jgi:adenosylmethionine-8-amino-7-oxononanoate aminotransferase